MAKIYKPTYSEVVNAGEQRLIDFLEVKLPDDYAVICNGEYGQQNRNGVVQYYEYDCILSSTLKTKTGVGNLKVTMTSGT